MWVSLSNKACVVNYVCLILKIVDFPDSDFEVGWRSFYGVKCVRTQYVTFLCSIYVTFPVDYYWFYWGVRIEDYHYYLFSTQLFYYIWQLFYYVLLLFYYVWQNFNTFTIIIISQADEHIWYYDCFAFIYNIMSLYTFLISNFQIWEVSRMFLQKSLYIPFRSTKLITHCIIWNLFWWIHNLWIDFRHGCN